MEIVGVVCKPAKAPYGFRITLIVSRVRLPLKETRAAVLAAVNCV